MKFPAREHIAAVTESGKKTVQDHPWHAAGIAIALVIAVVFCVRSLTRAVPARGGTFTEGTVGTLQIVNPVLAENEVDKQISRLVFSPLKDLITTSSVSYTKTQQVWHVSLRADAKWHDGEPVTPEDVLFTVHTIQDPQSNSPLAPSWESVIVDRTGEHELTVAAPLQFGYFSYALNELAPLPRHVYQPLPYTDWGNAEHALAPVGSGPFRFDKKTEKDGVLAAYSLKATGGSYIEEFIWKFFTDTNELVKNFDRGAVDGMVLLDPGAQRVVHAPHTVASFTLQNYYAAFVNPSKNEALRDQRVRQALQNALHKEDVLALVPGSTWFLDGIPTSSADPAALLEAAGWNKEGGTWVKHTDATHTTNLAVTLTVPDITFLKHTADYAAKQWQALGIPTQIVIVPVDTLAADTIPNRTYELLLFGNIVSPPDDLFPFWDSSQRFHPGLNLSLENDKRIDSLVETIRSARTATDRDRLFETTKTALAADAAAIFLYETPYTYVTGSRVHGVEATALGASADRFDGIRNWYIRTKRVWK